MIFQDVSGGAGHQPARPCTVEWPSMQPVVLFMDSSAFSLMSALSPIYVRLLS